VYKITATTYLAGKRGNKPLRHCIAIVCVLSCQGQCFVLPQIQKMFVDSIMTNIMNCKFDSAINQSALLIEKEKTDPIGMVMRMSTLAFSDLDYAHPPDTIQFFELYKKTESKILAYEANGGVNSYSSTLKGFSKAILACYDLWHKDYLPGLNIGFSALDNLKEAKKNDNENYDAEFFIGLYNYARADMKKMFWWAFFWYPGDKQAGIKSISLCTKNGQIVKPVALLVLAELSIREKKFPEALTLINDLETMYPKSRFVKWTHAKYFESQKQDIDAARMYGSLANEYYGCPKAIRNELAARLKEANLYFEANDFKNSKIAAEKLVANKNKYDDSIIKQMVKDAEKVLDKIKIKG